jgi:hypothetical protein
VKGFSRQGLVNCLPDQEIHLISASWVARITDVSHQRPALVIFLQWVIRVLATQEAEIRRIMVQKTNKKSSWDLVSTNSWAQWCTHVIQVTAESITRRTAIQAHPGIKWDLTSKITRAKRAQVVGRAFTCAKPWVQTLVLTTPPKKKKKKEFFYIGYKPFTKYISIIFPCH